VEVLTIVIPFAIFFTVRSWLRRRQLRPLVGNPSRNPSPGRGVIAWEWLRAHIRRDPDPDPDPTPLTHDFDWGSVDYTESAAKRQQVGTRLVSSKPVVPPVRPRKVEPKPKPLDVWVHESVTNGARYRDIISEGRRIFGVSESTVKRSIRTARKEQS
jgi:hypothetical protein